MLQNALMVGNTDLISDKLNLLSPPKYFKKFKAQLSWWFPGSFIRRTDRPVPEKRDIGFLFYGHEVLQVECVIV